MTNKEFIIQAKNYKVGDKKALKIEKLYNADLPLIVKAIISNIEKTIFLEDCRVLSYVEIIDASEDLGVDFVSKKFFPLIDCGENDFIVYHFDTKRWSMYNIIDDCSFKQKELLEDLLK